MSINTPNDHSADLQIGATDHGMVRLYVFSNELEVPMDFDPEDAREIAAEILAAADKAETPLK